VTPRQLRDATLFLAGLAGFAHEVVVTHGERPTMLLACLALMGFPIFLRQDEDRK
jgi:hypothetical protein